MLYKEKVQWESDGVSIYKIYSWACIVFTYRALAHFSPCHADQEPCIGAE